jgi:hypothetical protein
VIALNLDADLTANPVADQAQRRPRTTCSAREEVSILRDETVLNTLRRVTRTSLSLSGNDMRCAEAERYRNHFSLRQFQVNASSSFDQRQQRHPVTV